MSSASAIRAGAAYVELFTKDTLLVAGLKRAEAKIKAFGNAIAGIGTKFLLLGSSIAAPLLAAAASFAESGTELLLMSQRTGIAVEELSALRFAAGRAGVANEDLETGIKKMQKVLQQAADGSHTAQESLASLGLTVSDIADLSPDKQFERMAQGIASIQNPTTRSARAMEVFGRGGTALLPLLEKGAAGIEAYRKEAEKLGVIRTKESAEDAFALSRAFLLAKTAATGLYNTIGGAVAPLLTHLLESVIPFVGQIRQWIKDNKALWNVLLAVGGAVAGIGAGLIAVGGAFKFVAMAMSPLIGLVSFVWQIGGGLIALFWGLFTPIGALTVLLGGAVAAVLLFTYQGKATVSALKTGFTEVGNVFETTWSGISAAIGAGDWAGAINILMLGAKASFLTGLLAIQEAWLNLKDFFIQGFKPITDLMTELEERFKKIKAAVTPAPSAAKPAKGAGEVIPTTHTQYDAQRDLLERLNPIYGAMARTRDPMLTPVGEHHARGLGVLSEDEERQRSLRLAQGLITSNRIREHDANTPGAPYPPDLQALVDERNRLSGAGGVMGTPQGPGPGAVTPEDVAAQSARALAASIAAALAPLREEIAAANRVLEKSVNDAWDQKFWKDNFELSGAVEATDAPAAIDESRAKTDVKGTFSANAVAMLGASSVMEDLTRQIVRNTDPDRQNSTGFAGFG
jgi:hypothetical protein